MAGATGEKVRVERSEITSLSIYTQHRNWRRLGFSGGKLAGVADADGSMPRLSLSLIYIRKGTDRVMKAGYYIMEDQQTICHMITA